jgi:hypothetical protein
MPLILSYVPDMCPTHTARLTTGWVNPDSGGQPANFADGTLPSFYAAYVKRLMRDVLTAVDPMFLLACVNTLVMYYKDLVADVGGEHRLVVAMLTAGVPDVKHELLMEWSGQLMQSFCEVNFRNLPTPAIAGLHMPITSPVTIQTILQRYEEQEKLSAIMTNRMRTVLRYCGIVILRYCGTAVLRYLLRYCCTAVLRYCGTTVQLYCTTTGSTTSIPPEGRRAHKCHALRARKIV